MAKSFMDCTAGDHDPILQTIGMYTRSDRMAAVYGRNDIQGVLCDSRDTSSSGGQLSFGRKMGTELLNQADGDDPWTVAGEEFLDS